MDGFLMLLRWFHFLFGITWIGLLYYFNLVQVPFFGETEPAVRSGAIQKLVPRALWWFRWSAMGTVVIGWAYLMAKWGNEGFSWTPYNVAILTGGVLGTVMFLNVWLVIWPNQKIVIASAVAVAGGGQADPAAAPAGRRAALASRTNTVFSVPMLYFMGAAAHYPLFTEASYGGLAVWMILGLAIIGAVELNALVGTQGPTKKPLDTVKGTITSGFVLWAVLFLLIRIVM